MSNGPSYNQRDGVMNVQYQTKPTLFGLVESAEAFTGDGTAVPSLEM